MDLTLTNDRTHPGGGFAVLQGSGLSGVKAVSVENCFSNQFLSEDGKWGRLPFAFSVEPTDEGGLRLGPQIVDHVPTELQEMFRTGNGVELGRVFWVDIIPSRDSGSFSGLQFPGEEAHISVKVEAGMKNDGTPDPDLKALETDLKYGHTNSTSPKTPENPPEVVLPKPRSRKWVWLALAILILLLAAGARVLFDPGLQKHVASFFSRGEVTQPPSPPPPSSPPAPPPLPTAEECNKTFSDRLDKLGSLSDAEKVTLGKVALAAGCGLPAFKAFDGADKTTSEEAAWNVARFYDPNETQAVYRRTASIHPDYAAQYYQLWRNTPRDGEALRKICFANRGLPSLEQFCPR